MEESHKKNSVRRLKKYIKKISFLPGLSSSGPHSPRNTKDQNSQAVSGNYKIMEKKYKNFTGKIALVAGGSGFIGHAICIRLAAEGATVAVCATREENAKRVVNEIEAFNGKAIALELDVTNEQSIEKVFDFVIEKYGKLDMLVNCAGGSARGQKAFLHEQDIITIDRILNINLRGAILCMRLAARQMILQKSGKIINIASIVGLQGKAKLAEYSAAKAGIIAITKSLAIELGGYGITVNCVSPGLVPRGIIDNEKIEKHKKTNYLGRVGKPEEVANVAAFLFSDEADFITGQNYIVDGGRSLGLKGG